MVRPRRVRVRPPNSFREVLVAFVPRIANGVHVVPIVFGTVLGRAPVPRHPVHRQDRIRVLGSDLSFSRIKQLVAVGSVDHVGVQLDPYFDSEHHAPKLFKVERDVAQPAGVARADSVRMQHDQPREHAGVPVHRQFVRAYDVHDDRIL